MEKIANDMNCDTMVRLAKSHTDYNSKIRNLNLPYATCEAQNSINYDGYLPSASINPKHCVYEREDVNMKWWDETHMNPKFCVPELMMQNTKNRVNGNPNCFQQPLDNVEGNKYHSIIVPHTYANVPVNKGCSNGTVDRYNNHPHYTNRKEK